MKNNLKQKLRNNESVLGTMITVFASPELAKILKVCGFDFFVVDCEHGHFDYSAVGNLCAMAREAGIPAIIRVPEVRREIVLKYMEMGATGLLLPNCDTVEQARALVEYSKYYPLGNRGVSLLRAHTGFEKIDAATEYMKQCNEENVLMIQVESPTSVDNLEKILSIEGVDAAFVGPNDLSQSMGIMGQTDNPRFIAAVDHVIATAKAKGKYSGIHMMATPALRPWIDKGMMLNLWGNDVVFLMNAAKEGISKLKK
jgi:2-dehydro-3-deoxyglucarate aldolase/4-hydroxy-2-oxoheptanedioate aldolase